MHRCPLEKVKLVSLVDNDIAKLLELAPSKVTFDLDAGKDYLLDVIVD